MRNVLRDYSHTYLYGALKGLMFRWSVGPCGLLGPFLVDITLVFSLFPKFALTKIRVPGKWPYKTNGFGTHFLTFTHFSNGFLIFSEFLAFTHISNAF